MSERIALQAFAEAHSPAAALRLLKASEVSRRVNDEREALVVRRQAALLLEVLDQTVEVHQAIRAPFLIVLITKSAKRLADLVQKVLFRVDQRLEDGLLHKRERLDIRLRNAERLFELQYAVLSDHPDLPSIASMREAAERDFDEEASRVAEAGHRLSGDAK